MGITNQSSALSGKFRAQVAAIVAGEPELVRLDGRIRPADHLKLQVSNNTFQRNRGMREKILVALASGFLTSEKNKQHSSLAGTGLGERPGQFQNGNTPGGIIVCAVVDFIAIHRFANTQMVQMSSQQDHLILQPGVMAGKNGNHVARVQLLVPSVETEFPGDILDETAFVASRFKAELLQFGGDVGGGQ